MKKSYHSKVVPMKLAATTLRACRDFSSGAASDDGVVMLLFPLHSA